MKEVSIGRRSSKKSKRADADHEFIRHHLVVLFQSLIEVDLDKDPRTIGLLLKIAGDRGLSMDRLGEELYRLSQKVDKRRSSSGSIRTWNYVVRAISQQVAGDLVAGSPSVGDLVPEVPTNLGNDVAKKAEPTQHEPVAVNAGANSGHDRPSGEVRGFGIADPDRTCGETRRGGMTSVSRILDEVRRSNPYLDKVLSSSW